MTVLVDEVALNIFRTNNEPLPRSPNNSDPRGISMKLLSLLRPRYDLLVLVARKRKTNSLNNVVNFSDLEATDLPHSETYPRERAGSTKYNVMKLDKILSLVRPYLTIS